jgi:formate/nitrite transporter FocA (FNT family)
VPNPAKVDPEGDPGLASVFDRTVEEGSRRLGRTWPGLLATGVVGGIDVGLGVLALALVVQDTGSHLLGGLAFGIGFIALTLANSELFTENFLVPIATLAAGRSNWYALVRLWVGTLLLNLVGGWVIMAVVVTGLPQLRPTLIELGQHFVTIGHGRQALAAAVLGGTVITLMTWMQHGTDSVGARLVAALAGAFLLAAGSLDHAIVVSLEMFAALQLGAPFGYLDWLATLGVAIVGNMVGGIGLVTLLRLVQVGRSKIDHERDLAEDEPGDVADHN